jgi:hypothetical protein
VLFGTNFLFDQTTRFPHGRWEKPILRLRSSRVYPKGKWSLSRRTKLIKHRIVGIGFCSGQAIIHMTFPGWEEFTWGYHSDDGKVYTEGASGRKYGPKFGKGDIVGCGVDWKSEAYFFTLNGKFLGK